MPDDRLLAELTAERFGIPEHIQPPSAAGRPWRPFTPTDRTVYPDASDSSDTIERRRRILCGALNPVNERCTVDLYELIDELTGQADGTVGGTVVFLDDYRRGAA